MIETKISKIESDLNYSVDLNIMSDIKSSYNNFLDLIDDNKRIINWDNYLGKDRLEGTILIKNPPLNIPKFPKNNLNNLELYRDDLKNKLLPLKTTKSIDLGHQELFNQLILLLISCYPTYCRKDANFKKEKINNFQIFLEEYPIAIITKVIKEWIQTQKEYPTVSDLTTRIRSVLYKAQNRIDRIEKIILITTKGEEND